MNYLLLSVYTVLIVQVVHDVCARISERSHDPGCDVILHFVLGGSCQANPVIFNCLQVCCYDDHLDADILDPIHAIKVSQSVATILCTVTELYFCL